MKTSTIPTSASFKRRARIHSLVQLGGLMEHAGTLEVFNIPLGVDLQKDTSLKNNIAALFKGLLELNKLATSPNTDLNLWALQGLDAFKEKGLSEERPLDRKKGYTLSQDSANNNEQESFINNNQT